VAAVPPRLVLRDIAITPPLPDDLADVMARTPTWMADVVECVVVYERPFWRASGFLLGMAPGERVALVLA